MTNIVFALMVVVNGVTSTTAVFDTREQCLQEAQAIIKQGPSAYCVPVNQMNAEQAQAQVKQMMKMLNTIIKDLEKQ